VLSSSAREIEDEAPSDRKRAPVFNAALHNGKRWKTTIFTPQSQEGTRGRTDYGRVWKKGVGRPSKHHVLALVRASLDEEDCPSSGSHAKIIPLKKAWQGQYTSAKGLETDLTPWRMVGTCWHRFDCERGISLRS